jgi:tetratricopeptide (TPR) repeat protein
VILAWGVLLVWIGLARADSRESAKDHYQRGTRSYDLGNYDDAIREYSAAYGFVSDPAILFNLAQAHRLSNHPTEAIRLYRTYLSKVPNSPSKRDILRWIDEMSQVAATEDPQSVTARQKFQAGAALYAKEQYREAVVEFELGRSAKPMPVFDFNIGRCYERLGNAPEAIAAYERYISATPTPADAAEVRATIERLQPVVAKHEPETPPPAPPPKRRPWVWAVVGVAAAVVVGVGVGVGVGLGVHRDPSPSLGAISY